MVNIGLLTEVFQAYGLTEIIEQTLKLKTVFLI